MAFDLLHFKQVQYKNTVVTLLIIFETSYFFCIIIECFKAYDIEGDGTYEYNFRMTLKKYYETDTAKIDTINLIPFGLIG